MERMLAALAVFIMLCATASISHGGSLTDLSSAIQTNYVSGAIASADIKALLDDLVSQAQSAPDTEAENSYRSSFTDIVDAYTGGGISSSAATQLKQLAQP